MAVACPVTVGAPAHCGTALVDGGLAVSTGPGPRRSAAKPTRWSPSSSRSTTPAWSGWQRCCCVTNPSPRRRSRMRSYRYTADGGNCGIQQRRGLPADVGHPQHPFDPAPPVGRCPASRRPATRRAQCRSRALRGVAGTAVVEALRRLPARQREALVLRYYADLSEAEIAEAMRISRGAVKSHASRGMAALRETLEQWA